MLVSSISTNLIVMHHIIKYREFRRVPKLKDILMMAINKKKKEMQAARKKQQSFLLDQRSGRDQYLTEE